MQPFVVADRRDLLGGRLIVLLNARYIARQLGLQALMTWYNDASAYQELVANVREIFEGELVLPFDGDGTGRCIHVDQLTKWRCKSSVEILPVDQNRDIGIHDALVVIQPDSLLDVDAFIIDRRFSIYTTNSASTYDDTKKGLAKEFAELPFVKEISKTLETIRACIKEPDDVVSLHVRRLHYNSNTELPITRLHSYCSMTLLRSFILSQAKEKRILLSSDSEVLCLRLKEEFGDRIILLKEIVETSSLTSIQLVLADLYFLSRASCIYGSLTTIGLLSSIIANRRFINMLYNANELKLECDGLTGFVPLMQSRLNKSQADLAANIDSASPYTSALYWQIAVDIIEGRCSAEGVNLARLALIALAMRCSSITINNFAGDTKDFVSLSIRCRQESGDKQSVRILEAFWAFLSKPDLEQEQILAALLYKNPLSETELLLNFIASVTIGDFHRHFLKSGKASDYYRMALEISKHLSIQPIGVMGKLAELEAENGDIKDAIDLITAAIKSVPNAPHLHFIYGMLLLLKGDSNSAVNAIKRALWLEPETGEYLKAMHDVLISCGDFKDAYRYLHLATLSDPGRLDWQKGLAQLRTNING